MRKYNLLILLLFLSTGLYAQLTVSISKQDACNGLSNGSITILVTNADGPPILNVIGIPGLIGQPLSVGVPFIFDDSGSGLPTGLYSLVVQDFINPSFFQDVTIIDATPIVSYLGLAGPYCEDAGIVALSGLPLPPPGTGVWTTTAPGGLTDNLDGTASFDPSLATPGTWDITYTYTNALGCTDFDTQSVTINAVPVVSFGGLAGPYCEDAGIVALSGLPLPPPGTGVWTTTAPGGLTDNLDGTASFDPSLATPGTWDITYTYTNALGCTDFDTQSVTINAVPVVSFGGLAGPYCEDAGIVALSGLPLPPPGTGVWTTTAPGGLTDNLDGTASFDPSLATPGTWDITYTYTNALGCTDFDTQSVTINAVPVVSFGGLAGPYCEDEGIVALSGLPLPPPGTGVWTTTAPGGLTDNLDGTASFDPSLATPGTWDITYTYTNALGCSDFDTQSVTINAVPVVSFGGLAGPYCEDAGIVALSGLPLPPPGTGVWTTTAPGGLTDNLDGTASFDPSLATPGTWDITYTYTNALGCTDFDTQSVTINAIPVVSFGGLAGPYCEDAGIVALSGLPLPPPGTGVWTTTAPGGLTDNLDGTASFDPSLATPGTWDITYTYTDGAGCSDFDTQSVTINAVPVVSFGGLAGLYCEDAGIVALSGLPLPPPGTGVWTTTAPGGLTDNLDGTASFDPSLATPGTWDITYTYTNALGCSDFDTQSVTINAIPVVSFGGLAGPYCEDAGIVALSGLPLPPPGTGVWTTTAPGGLTDNLDGTASFDPSLATPGTWDITYTYADGAGCSDFDTQSVTINAIPVVSFGGLAGPYCEDAGIVALSGLPLPPPGTGVWTTTAPGGLTDNLDGTASFDPSLATPGTWDITYTYTNALGCSDFDTQSVTINAIPVVSFGGLAGPYCEDAGIVALSGLPLPPPGTGVWTTTAPGGLTDNLDGTASFDPSLATPGTWDITYTYADGAGCSDFDTQSVTINAIPVVSFGGLAGPYCEDAGIVALSGLPLPPPGTGVWTTTAPGGLTDNLDGTASFDPSLVTPGTWDITYTYTNAIGCSDFDTQSVTINAIPVVSFGGLAGPYCEDAGIVALSGLPLPPPGTGVWTTTAPGGLTDNLDGTASFDPSLATPGTWDITYTYTDGAGCTDFDTQLVTINALPVVSYVGLAATYCFDDASAALTGSPLLAPGVWSTTAPGGLTDNSDGTASFDPSLSTAGTWDITYTYTDGSGCINFDTQSTIVHPQTAPSFTGPTLVCLTSPSVTYTVAAGQTNYIWVVSAGGTITLGGNPTDDFVDVTWTVVATESIDVSFTDTNGCLTVFTTSIDVFNTSPAPLVTSPVEICQGDPSPALTIDNFTTQTVRWYDDPGLAPADLLFTGNPYTPLPADLDTSVPASTSFYVTQEIAGCGEGPFAEIVVIVNSPPDAGNNTSTDACDTDTAIDLFIELGGTPDAGGTWNDDDATGALVGSIFNPSLAVGTSPFNFTYTTSTNGCPDATAVVTVTVETQPDAGVDNADNACVTDSSYDLFPRLGGTPDPGGAWSDDDGTGALTGSIFDPSVAGMGTYNFTYSFTGLVACADVSATVTVTVGMVSSAPIIDGPQDICSGDPAPVLNATGTNVMWYDDPGLAPADLVFTGNPYTPLPAELDTTTPGTTTYYVTQDEGCGESTATSYDVNVLDKSIAPVITPVPDLCLNDPIPTLMAVGDSIVWHSNSLATDTLAQGNVFTPSPSQLDTDVIGMTSFFATQETGCGRSDATETIVNVIDCVGTCFTQTVVTSDASCLDNDGSISFILDGSELLPVSYRLYELSGTDTVFQQVQSGGVFSSLSSAIYDYEIIDSQSCGETGQATVQLTLSTVEATVSLATPVGCVGDQATFDVTVTSGGSSPYQYSSDGGTIWQDLVASQIQLTAGNYDIYIRDDASDPCPYNAGNFTVDEPTGIAYTILEPTESFPERPSGTITITDVAGGVPGYEIQAELITPTSPYPGQSYLLPFTPIPFVTELGKFEIVLDDLFAGIYMIQIRDTNGCIEDVFYQAVDPEVPLDDDLFIPNVFTPNSDGSNDFFFIRNLPDDTDTQLTVTNRYGKQVYGSVSYKNDWDGEGLPDGVYYYIVVITVEGQEFDYNGWVEIWSGL